MFGSSRGRGPTPEPCLHRCAFCRADTVVPVWWEDVDGDHWHILLRCGECGTYREVVATDELALAFERHLDRGVAEIRAEVARLEHAASR